MARTLKRERVKYRDSEPAPKKLKLEGSLHAHRCTQCRERYEDSCLDAQGDGTCASCRGGSEWPSWRSNRLPQPCCRVRSQKATQGERQQYRLGGQATWWICQSCKRTHPYNPEGEDHVRSS